MRNCARQLVGTVTLLLITWCAGLLRAEAASASFAWDASPDAATGKVAGYKFYYSTQSFTTLPADAATNPAFTVVTVSGTTINLPNLVAGQTYFMAVTAVGSNLESRPSNVLTYTVPGGTEPLTVAITSPTGPLTVFPTDTVTITATASGPNAISKVEFFDGALLLSTRTAAPYSFQQVFAAGVHTVTAKVTDALNNTATSTALTITGSASANLPPIVSVTAPANNAQFPLGQSVPIAASASDVDGSVTRVEFYVGSSLVATKTAPPYSITQGGIAVGTRVLTVKAFDNAGAATTSSPITITVGTPANVAPTVAITAPANNAQFSSGQSVTITANASDSDGTIARVDFYDGATLIGTKSASPYSVSLSSMTSGSHALTAKAVDNVGAITTSASVNISVAAPNAAPTVAITTPVNNAQFSSGQSVTITANASDSDGTVSRVDFYDGATLIGTKSTSPYSVSISSMTSGSHVLTAKAVDNLGVVTTSAPINISLAAPNTAPAVAITTPVNNAQFSSGQSVTITANASDSDGTIFWVDFYDGATLIGTTTESPYSISISSMTSGSHVLTAKAVDNLGAVTTSAEVNISIAAPNTAPTVAITTPVNNAQFSSGQSVTITADATDSNGTIARVDFYDGATMVGTKSASPYSVSIASMTSGSHVLTAKAVDNLGAVTTSAPINISVAAPNTAPTIAITAPANNAQFSSGQAVTITANATDSDGTIARVDFYDGATLVGTKSAGPYSVSVSSMTAGSHLLTAKAVDNVGAITISAPVNIAVSAPNTAPTVAIVTPVNNAQFSSGQSVTITANASDSDGTISRVEFYDGATLIGTKTASSYSVAISNLSAGSHVLTAKAVDNLGAVTTSAPVNISVQGAGNSLPTVSLAGLTENALLSQPVVLTASASDSDGTISSVEFFANDTSLGSSTAAPFGVSLPLVSGTYIFKAKAVDNLGGVSFSEPITANVKPAPPVDLVIK